MRAIVDDEIPLSEYVVSKALRKDYILHSTSQISCRTWRSAEKWQPGNRSSASGLLQSPAKTGRGIFMYNLKKKDAISHTQFHKRLGRLIFCVTRGVSQRSHPALRQPGTHLTALGTRHERQTKFHLSRSLQSFCRLHDCRREHREHKSQSPQLAIAKEVCLLSCRQIAVEARNKLATLFCFQLGQPQSSK